MRNKAKKQTAKAEDVVFSEALADNEDKEAIRRMEQADQRVENKHDH
ncbi:hypothetical protein Pryu01_01477 [Paraliobacillus ryukyuensis]|uniref:YfhD-like protein n=1 Tax=Paraliobacillus ryukyuensis TaxID=200904 RepID=A0A366EBM5_9BACI|nr:YfhD-like protein [Paraliobacillus ryukyuensis]